MSYPLDHVLCESTQSPFLKVIAAVLDAVVRESRDRGPVETSFDARAQPTVGLHDYLKRWARYTRCGVTAVVAAVMYIDRACMKAQLMVTPINVHRFLLAALLVASKYCHDIPFRNSHYAQVGGVPLAELNALERDLLSKIGFDCSLPSREFEGYIQMFRNHRDWPSTEESGGRRVRVTSVTGSGSTDNGLSDCPTDAHTDRRSSRRASDDRRSSGSTMQPCPPVHPRSAAGTPARRQFASPRRQGEAAAAAAEELPHMEGASPHSR